jgi:non-ribosomal peptide synthetase-like protein
VGQVDVGGRSRAVIVLDPIALRILLTEAPDSTVDEVVGHVTAPPAPKVAVGGLGTPTDLNRATVVELQALPGIGPAMAAAIVEHRERHAPFASVEDLLLVRNIGPTRLERVRAAVAVGESLDVEARSDETTEPEVATTEPEVATTEPEVAATEPEVAATEPEVAATEPEVAATEPEVAATEPEVAATDTEGRLADVLAEIMEVDSVPVTGNFFDDLGADSMVMAHFCARLRKRDDLPSVSIKQVYQHPSIDSLARSFAEDDDAPCPVDTTVGPRAPAPPQVLAPSVPRYQHVACGALQTLILLGIAALVAFVVARGYDWVSAGSGLGATYLRAAVFGAAVFVVWVVVPIVAKWVLVGRWRPEEIPIWSLRYVRFWFLEIAARSNPMVAFAGSPLYVLYLRALGAKIGRGVVILSGNVPVCADLVTIGDNAVIRKDSSFACYRARGRSIETGTIHIGADAFVGEGTVLDIDTSLGDGAQIGHSSALYRGQSIPAGEHRVGTPALQSIDVDFRAVAPGTRAALRRVGYSFAQVFVLLAISTPLISTVLIGLAEWRISPLAAPGSPASQAANASLFLDALIFSLVVFAFLTVGRMLVAVSVPRVLARAVQPDTAYPMYGLRYWAHQTIGRLTNVSFLTNVVGDSSYIVHYLYFLGYDVSFEEQTGANFGLNVKHENPYHVSVGPGTMAADGLSIANVDYSNSSFRVAHAAIGAHSFLGNNIVYPSDGSTGENCLHASKVSVPIEGDVREDAGFLGSPSFEIPRMVFRDRQFDELNEEDERRRRLGRKNRHNVVSMLWFLLTRWIGLFAAVLIAFGAVEFYPRLGTFAFAVMVIVLPAGAVLYNVFIERAAAGFKPLAPLHCSIYDERSFRIERYWKLSWQPTILNGTPFKSFMWRLLGVRVGRRLFDDGGMIMEKTMVTLGDDCVLNAGSVVQPHSQEDGSFKSDYVRIGSGCSVGVGALVHYGVTMGDGATLAPNAFLMKGTDVPPYTSWGDNPARELDETAPRDETKSVDVAKKQSGTKKVNGMKHEDARQLDVTKEGAIAS